MANMEIYTGSYGFKVLISTGMDLSQSEKLTLKIKTPASVVVSRPLIEDNINGLAKDGMITYTTKSNDFPVPGLYKIQVFDETPGTQKLASPVVKIRVKPSIEYTGS